MSDLSSAADRATLCVVTLFIGETRYGWITGASVIRIAEHNQTLDLLDRHDVSVAIRMRHLIDAETPAVAGTSWMTAGKLNYTVGRTVPFSRSRPQRCRARCR